MQDLYPLGQVTDYGDFYKQVRYIAKGLRPHFRLHDGAERDTVPADRVPNSTPAIPAPDERIHMARDLAQDKKFTRTYAPVDEFGAPASSPFVGTQEFSTDRPDLVAITDNGDGSAVIAAVGGIDTSVANVATVTFTATPAGGGAPVVITDLINVVAGAPEGFAAVDGPDEEVTPDA